MSGDNNNAAGEEQTENKLTDDEYIQQTETIDCDFPGHLRAA